MLSKNVVKDIQSLGLKKNRQEQGLFLAEGPKIVSELAPLLGETVVMLYATAEWIAFNQTLAQTFPTETITETELQKISQLQTPNGVVMIAKMRTAHQPPVAAGITLYLDTVQDPGNLGTIIRIADWFGVKDIVCSAGCAELYNPKVVQSTMASLARVNVWYEEGEWISLQKAPLLAAALDGNSVHDFKTNLPAILMIGNESKGLRPELLDKAAHRITIPRIGDAESLNAGVATGIILSHLTR
jgi:TrmH family RNA methyltransferase